MTNLIKTVSRKLLPANLHLSVLVPRLIKWRALRYTRMKVTWGPFHGMRYVRAAVGSALIPKLLGIYERELNEFVEAMIQYKPGTVIDIGAAEGYYAVGFAMRLQESSVIAYESSEDGRALMSELARLNGVSERLEIHGSADVSALKGILGRARRPAVLCDVEGAEADLLDPDLVPELKSAAILVELHPHRAKDVDHLIRKRFEGSHEIRIAIQEQRHEREFPCDVFRKLFPQRYIQNAVSENRINSATEWLWMTPLAA